MKSLYSTLRGGIMLGAIAAAFLAGGATQLLGAEDTALEVGVAQVDITPDYPVRLSGFGFRREESEGVTDRIFAKALVFADEKEGPAILITADNLCVPDEITQEVARRLGPKLKLKGERFTITATHTHTAPMLKDICPTLFGVPIPPEHQTNIHRYTAEFIDKLEGVALAAAREVRPARVSFGIGTADLAINRRTKGGPVDHDLPVLAVRETGGKLRAIYFSYACHCVTMSDNKISGDWAGFAQKAVEEDHPGALALASVGCGADSNPNARGDGKDVALCRAQGRGIADEVKRVLGGKMKPVNTAPRTKYSRVAIAFDTPLTRAEWEERAKLQNPIGHHARVTIEKLDRGEKLPEAMDYPIQSWIFGSELAMVFLPGETVVDYSLRLKKEYDRARLWVNGYSNEGRCYVPSERILQEGGYEGGGAMVYYDYPNRFAPGLEEKIMGAVATQLPEEFKAQPGTEGTRPLEPKDALRSFRAKPGHVVELVAAEPLVQDPVAIDWGADGKLWVCEMHDYPSGTDNNWQPGGRVKFLTDRDGDGVYDEATVFAEGLPFPTGLMAWRDGVLICAAPNILFARDENGDGKADKIEKLFSGFATDNYQARVNSPTLGLDNWIYFANGLLGGSIRAEKNSLLPERGVTPLDIRGRDIRISPLTGVIETVSGLTQQGRARDDWGNWFGCDNTRLVLHFPRPERYMRRNPHVPAPEAARLTTTGRDANRVFPTSRLLERFNDPDNANRVTSAGGLGIYRDTLLGEEFNGNAFTCEPVHNLVHREVLSGDLIFSSRRAEDERESEFLSSTDNWFRPVQARTGPDGALYVVDMYRFLIEHPRWIPAERLAQIDIRAGADRGRIYRVRREGAAVREVRDLKRLSTVELASALDSPNGTERDRVHSEVLGRRDKDSAATVLRELAHKAELPQVRVQALAVIEGIGGMDEDTLLRGLGDRHAGVKEFALQLAEAPLRKKPTSKLLNAVLELNDDSSLRVVRQVAFTLGELDDPRAGEALAQIAVKHVGDAEIRAAVLSSALAHRGELFDAIGKISNAARVADEWMSPLIATAVGSKDQKVLARALKSSLPAESEAVSESQLTSLATILGGVKDSSARQKLVPKDSSEAKRLSALLAEARKVASNAEAKESVRIAAVKFVSSLSAEQGDCELLARIGAAATSNLRRAALNALRDQSAASTADELLRVWPEASPSARGEILALLTERADWTKMLLSAVQSGTVPANAISIADRQRLARSEHPAVRELAAKVLLEQGTATRAEVLKRYPPALVNGGDRTTGAKIFAEQCASCHALNGAGHDVGPDLATLRNKEPDYWVQNILDPNAVIEPRFVNYEVELTDDRLLSGVIKNETSTGLTVVSGNGITETVLRANIKKLRALNLSLMPEGLEQAINPGQMASLIAYIREGVSRKKVAGNEPAAIAAAADGVFILAAAKAEIVGDQITFETQFANIGLWHGRDDRVEWSLRVEKEGRYDVHLDYACASASAGNTFIIAVGDSELRGTVAATGGDWSNYQQIKVGEVQLPAGSQRLMMRPDGPVRFALIDLRTVALVPAGQRPRWPTLAATRSDVLRDAPSVARFILDSTKSQSARETAVQANPQFAAALITEMTRDLSPGTREEYIRIPWIWRVAIACGRRNDAGQIRGLLGASLPKLTEPLRDWQAVVLGGGVINGISERGVAPAQRIAEIIGGDTGLLERWRRAVELSSEMAENEKVAKGTRYDALRMLGVELWEKRGTQLARYLGKDVDAELQMGAVSGLLDMHSPEADQTLVNGLRDLTEHNRTLALNTLVSRRAAPRVLELIEKGTLPRSALRPEHLEKLLQHENASVRQQARSFEAKPGN